MVARSRMTASAIGERQILPKQTAVMRSGVDRSDREDTAVMLFRRAGKSVPRLGKKGHAHILLCSGKFIWASPHYPHIVPHLSTVVRRKCTELSTVHVDIRPLHPYRRIAVDCTVTGPGYTKVQSLHDDVVWC